MFICVKCNSVFSEPDEAVVDRYPYGDRLVEVTGAVCPRCGHNETADAIQCDICGEYFEEFDLNNDGELMLCDACQKREYAHIRGINV